MVWSLTVVILMNALLPFRIILVTNGWEAEGTSSSFVAVQKQGIYYLKFGSCLLGSLTVFIPL